MNVIIIVIIIAALLFTLAFFTKRRFGILGLALTAGAMLSDMWAKTATPYVEQAGLQVVAPPMETIVSAAIILLPAIILLFGGPKYTKLQQKAIGSAAFALLALAFLLTPLSGAFIITGQAEQFFKVLTDNREYIITAGILFAIVDILIAKKPKHIDKEK